MNVQWGKNHIFMNVQWGKNHIFMNVRHCGWCILDVVCDNVVSRPPQRKLEMWIRGIVYCEIFVKFFWGIVCKMKRND